MVNWTRMTVPLEINDDGTFSVAVPMLASRKGKDKDGRLYSVKFMAENEAGVGESPGDQCCCFTRQA